MSDKTCTNIELRSKDLIIPESMVQDYCFTNALEKLVRNRLHNCFSSVTAKSKHKSDWSIIKSSLLIIHLMLIITVTPVAAEENMTANTSSVVNEMETDAELLDELLGIVDEGTEIATQTHMNTHFVPGTVTVLQGKEMEALGVTTAWDALALVPGILPSKDPTGGTSVIARGINFPFSSGNIKILVNSLSMTQESSGINSSILQIPIEQIQRIEVVRGPGAILYGDNAFMGLVNIVTYSDNQHLFVRYESKEAISGGAMGSYKNEQHQLKIQGNAYGYGNHDADSPVEVRTAEDRQFGVFSLTYHDFSIRFQSYHRYYQPNNQGTAKEGNDIFSARQLITMTPALTTELNFSYLMNDFRRADQAYKGDKLEGSIGLNWTGWDQHNMRLKFTYTGESIDDAFRRQRVQRPPVLRPPAQRPSVLRPPPLRPTALHLSNEKRKYLSLSLQDQFDITDYLALTIGLRYDYRDDIDRHIFTPRVSAVWRVTDEHILKAQYAEGFRVPTFFELYTQDGLNELSEEKIATTEFSYIFHQTTQTGQITFFYSQLTDIILPEQNSFRNSRKGQSWGVEVEWEQQITKALSWQANFSYVDSWNTRARDGSEQEDQAAASWLSNISIFYRPIEQVLLAAHWNYIGPRHKSVNLDVAAQNKLALTISTFDIFTQGLGFKIGVQNVLGVNEQYINVMRQNSNILNYGDHAIVWTQFSYAL